MPISFCRIAERNSKSTKKSTSQDRVAGRHEPPVVLQVAERPLEILDVDGPRLRPQRHPAAEALAVDLEGDHEVGLHHLAGAVRQRPRAADPRRGAPGQELRIAPDIGDQRVHLVGAVGHAALLGMGRHGRLSDRSCGLSAADNANRMPPGTRPKAGSGAAAWHEHADLCDRRADLGEGHRRAHRGAGARDLRLLRRHRQADRRRAAARLLRLHRRPGARAGPAGRGGFPRGLVLRQPRPSRAARCGS